MLSDSANAGRRFLTTLVALCCLLTVIAATAVQPARALDMKSGESATEQSALPIGVDGNDSAAQGPGWCTLELVHSPGNASGTDWLFVVTWGGFSPDYPTFLDFSINGIYAASDGAAPPFGNGTVTILPHGSGKQQVHMWVDGSGRPPCGTFIVPSPLEAVEFP